MLLRQIDHAGPECHLDLDKRLIAIGQQIFGLSRIDPNDTQQQMAGRSKGQFDFWLHDAFDALLDVRFENVCLGEFLVPVSGQPDARERAFLGQHDVSVKHDEAVAGGSLSV